MMTKNSLFRVSAIAVVLAAAIAASQAVILNPVYATPFRFTSGAAQSSVEVIVSNSNPVALTGTLTLVVEQPNGVQRVWPAGTIYIPVGNSNHRVLIPAAIAGVKRAVVANLRIVL